MRVLLFDIDGTLLLAPGLGKLHFEDALADLCRKTVDARGIQYAGRTDRSLAREMLSRAGYRGYIEAAIDDVLDRYATRLEASISPEQVRVLPGVTALLDRLSGVTHLGLGLLTGNLERTALAKLRAAGLESYFSFGAWGCDHESRNELPAFARRRAESATSTPVSFDAMVVIGDTEHDVACGKAVGAATVAVNTGMVSPESLARSNPDLFLEDFTHAQPLYDLIGA